MRDDIDMKTPLVSIGFVANGANAASEPRMRRSGRSSNSLDRSAAYSYGVSAAIVKCGAEPRNDYASEINLEILYP